MFVSRGYFTTRMKAKEMIKRGFVMVNGKVIKKPSYDVDPSAEIVVLETEKPKGYWKLKELDESWGFIENDAIVLDLGSSAGGFLLYASEKAKRVYGIEYSREFEETLRDLEKSRKNVKVFIEDAFKFDLNKLEPIDLILSDLTLDPVSAWKCTSRFLKVLKPDGMVFFVMKTGLNRVELDFTGLKILKVKDSDLRREKYYLLRRDRSS